MKEANQSMSFEKKDHQKVYIKPIITRVQLVAGEAVLATCKFGDEISLGQCNQMGDQFCNFSPRS